MDCFVSAAVKKVSIIYIILGKLTCMLKLNSFQLSGLIKPTNQDKNNSYSKILKFGRGACVCHLSERTVIVFICLHIQSYQTFQAEMHNM